MKITKHRDGTFTLSEVSQNDMGMLKMGLSWKAAIDGSWADFRGVNIPPPSSSDDAMFSAREAPKTERLRRELEVACNGPYASVGAEYLPYGKSITLRSDNWAAESDETAYQRVKADTKFTKE